MNATQKPQRAFLAVTLLTVLAVTSVFMVYAVILSTLYGGNVTVVGFTGNVWYDESNSTNAADWTAAIANISASEPWYAKLNITTSDYTGAATVTWTLQKLVSGDWEDQSATQSTSTTITGSTQTIYAASTGTDQANNKNWGAETTSAATYRIKAVITHA